MIDLSLELTVQHLKKSFTEGHVTSKNGLILDLVTAFTTTVRAVITNQAPTGSLVVLLTAIVLPCMLSDKSCKHVTC
jgi:hypothetical protein